MTTTSSIVRTDEFQILNLIVRLMPDFSIRHYLSNKTVWQIIFRIKLRVVFKRNRCVSLDCCYSTHTLKE